MIGVNRTESNNHLINVWANPIALFLSYDEITNVYQK